MKTLVVLGLLATMALVAPVATAHIIVTVGNDCTAGTVIGDPASLPHAGIWVGRCEFNHGGPSPLAALP